MVRNKYRTGRQLKALRFYCIQSLLRRVIQTISNSKIDKQ